MFRYSIINIIGIHPHSLPILLNDDEDDGEWKENAGRMLEKEDRFPFSYHIVLVYLQGHRIGHGNNNN